MVGSGGFVGVGVCCSSSLLVGHFPVVWANCRASYFGLYRSIFALGVHHTPRMPIRVFCAVWLCVLYGPLCLSGMAVLEVAFGVLWPMVVLCVPPCGGIRLRTGFGPFLKISAHSNHFLISQHIRTCVIYIYAPKHLMPSIFHALSLYMHTHSAHIHARNLITFMQRYLYCAPFGARIGVWC